MNFSRRKRGIGLLVVLLALGSLAWGCGTSSTNQSLASAADSTPLRTSTSFKDEFDAQIGTNGHSLFMFVNGLSGKKGVWSRVMRWSQGGWKPASPMWSSSTDSGLYMAFRKTPIGRLPCVADTARSKFARLQCLGPGGWKRIALPRNTPWQYLVQGMATVNGQIVVPLNEIEKTHNRKSRFRSTTKLSRLAGDRLVQLGPLMRVNKQSVVKMETTVRPSAGRQPLRLAVTTQSDPTQQWISTLTKQGWKRAPESPRLSGAKSLTGPVRASNGTFMLTSETQPDTGDEYSAYVFRKSSGNSWDKVGGKAINVGEGSAQGGLFAVGNRVWAVWNENSFGDAAFGGMIPTSIHAARISKDGTSFDRRVKLWTGRVVFPGSVQMIAYKGRPVALFMTQKSKATGMHATIKALAR